MAGAKLSRRLHCRKAAIARKGLVEMLDKGLEEEQAPSVDERLASVVRIIVEQYDRDVKAFVESNRYRHRGPIGKLKLRQRLYESL